MMNYDEFKDQVVEHIKEHLPKPKDTRAVDLDAIEKAEKSNPKHERKSVKAQISEKKAIIAKKAAEKASPAKNHQAEL